MDRGAAVHTMTSSPNPKLNDGMIKIPKSKCWDENWQEEEEEMKIS